MKQFYTVIAFLIFTNLSFSQNEKLDPNYVPVESPEFSRLMEYMKKKPVVFTINNTVDTVDTVLELPSGTKLTIAQNAFTNSNGDIIKGEVIISFNEFISVADMIAEGLVTIDSDGNALESGGMFHIKATDKNGEELKLNPTSSITIDLMSDAKAKPYNIYSSQTGKNWQLQKSDHLYVLPLAYYFSLKKTQNGLHQIDRAASFRYDELFGGNFMYVSQSYKLGNPFSDNFPFVFDNNAINFLDFVFPKPSDKNKAIKIFTNKEKLVTNFKVQVKEYGIEPDSVKIKILSKNNQYNANLLAERLEYMLNGFLSEGWSFKKIENFVVRVITYSTPILPSTGSLEKLGNEMSNYTFSIKSLGYKNLDKLLDDKSPRVSIKVQHNSIDLLGTCYLTFKNRKVLLNKSLQTTMTFNQIVKDEPCKVVAYGLQNGKIMYAETDFVADSNKSINLNFQELNSEEVLKDKIKGI